MGRLQRVHLADQPFEQFARWFEEAAASGEPEPEAMALATSTRDGAPAVRFVLLRSFGPAGWTFYTNLRSRKGVEIEANPRAALAFRWGRSGRQVRVDGLVEAVTDADSDAYFARRPRSSQLGAWASHQSQPLNAEGELDRRVEEMHERFAGIEVPRPPWWGGLRVVAEQVEFWQQGDSRLHDRFVYKRDGTTWKIQRLNP
jgi:pyridoxamine 5'-phosphate oxidase